MEDHLSDEKKRDLEEWLKELKEQMAELQVDLSLPEEEKTVLNNMKEWLGLLVVQPPSLYLDVFLSLSLMAGWKLGFLPSECLASFRRAVPCETDFWLGCISYLMKKGDYPWETDEVEKTRDFFERALKDASLPRKMRMASLQLKAWCHVALWEFGGALMTLTELKQIIITSEGKERVDYLINYIGRLHDNYLGVEEEEPWHIRTLGEQTLLVKEQGELYRHATKFVILPDAEFGDFLPSDISRETLPQLTPSLPSSTADVTKDLLDDLAKTFRLNLWQVKKEIIAGMPNPERPKDRLKRDFFSDTWEELPVDAQNILVSAEIQWMNNRADTMVKDFRQLLELVLPAVFPLLEPMIRQSDAHLILTRMKDELLNKKLVQASIDSLKIDNADKTWAKDELPRFLQKVINSRNYFEKDSYLPDKKLKLQEYLKIAVDIHSELLGIGCKGVLPRLMRIKKVIRDKK